MNHAVISGNLTKDPVVKDHFTAFTVAVNYREGDEKKAFFVDCICFDTTAKHARELLCKGQRTVVYGQLRFKEGDYPCIRLIVNQFETFPKVQDAYDEPPFEENRKSNKRR